MPNTIKIRRSTTAGVAPSSLVTGELAINEADGILYYRNSSGTPTPLVDPQGALYYGNASPAVDPTLAQMLGRVVIVNTSAAAKFVSLGTSGWAAGNRITFVRSGSNTATITYGLGPPVAVAATLTQDSEAVQLVAKSTGEWVAFPSAASGTWTPTIFALTTNPTLTYTTQLGTYQKQGSLVNVSGHIKVNTLTSAGSGALGISGLPFTCGSLAGTVRAGWWSGWTTQGPQVGYVGASSNNIYLFFPNGGGTGNLTNSHLAAGAEVVFSATYYTA